MFKQKLSEEIFKKKYCINDGDTDIESVFWGIAKEISSVEKTDKDKRYWEEQFYMQMIEEKFIPAGRIMANARPNSKVKNYNNCFLIDIEDSMEGIYNALKDDALIQKQGGGVGFNLSKLRPEGANISKGGDSSGPLSFLKVFNESAKCIHTGGGRRGAHLCCLDVTHPDIEKFITCKRGDQNKEYTQFNLSVGITDDFIKAVKEDKDWDLVFDGKVYKTVKAKYLYELITKNAFIFAEPGILNLDTINKESNVWYIGEIKATNPCVIGSTPILTDKGNIPIKDLVGKEVNIWNGFEWSKVIPKKTGENQPLMKVGVYVGSEYKELICTFYHKFILINGTRVEAQDLKIGSFLQKYYKPSDIQVPSASITSYVSKLELLDYTEDVYCFTEEKNHSGIFGGIFTAQCGEVPLLPYESCNLGSLKLSTFVLNPFTEKATIDWKTLENSIKVAVKFLDNNLDASSYPLKRIKDTVKSLRRIGLGFTAYADMLIKLGLSYGSKEALEFTEKLGTFIRNTAYQTSIELAKKYGAFEKFDSEKFLSSNFCKRLPEDIKENIKKYGIRNSNLLSVAPTGTISLSVGNNCSSGIEPVFSFEQTRKVRTGNGDETKNETTYSEVYLDYLNYAKEKGWDKIGFPKWFKTTANITPKEHIDTQAVWQKYIDNSISKTCNLPKEFTYEEYKNLFIYAYDKGCKGFTTFWEGGALAPILSDAKKPVLTSPCSEIVEHCSPKRPIDLPCDIHQIVVDHKPVLVLVGKLKDKIYEVFFDYNFSENGDKKIDVMKAKEGIIRKVKSNVYSLIIKTDEEKDLVVIDNIADTFDETAGMIARFLSMSFRYGVPYQFILAQLQKTKNFNSFTKIVARVLKKYIKDGEKVKTGQNKCPECGAELVFESGCVVCPSCGFSKCS